MELKKEKLILRVYGEAELIQFRLFNKKRWNQLLTSNNLNSIEFGKQLFDPDFFTLNSFPNSLDLSQANSMGDFFGERYFFGPLFHQMAIVDMKFARKKIYRGTLNRYVGEDTLFPLVNLKFDSIKIGGDEETVLIYSVEKTTGQIVNSFLITEQFDPESFVVSVIDLRIGINSFKLISGFNYNNIVFKKGRPDCIIRSQHAYVL